MGPRKVSLLVMSGEDRGTGGQRDGELPNVMW